MKRLVKAGTRIIGAARAPSHRASMAHSIVSDAWLGVNSCAPMWSAGALTASLPTGAQRLLAVGRARESSEPISALTAEASRRGTAGSEMMRHGQGPEVLPNRVRTRWQGLQAHSRRFGGDGSYYVTAPVHPAQRALLAVFSVNYAEQRSTLALSDSVDLAAADAEDKEIKLSHHFDGFMQFSGAGLVSGRDDEGNIRGVGVDTWPLTQPTRGPAFALAITDLEHLAVETSDSAETLLFTEDDVTPLPSADQVVLEGYFFPPLWRRFVRRDRRGELTISVFHPAKAVLQLRVALPPDGGDVPGFLAFEVYTNYLKLADEDPRPGFIMSGSTGNLRRNEHGEMLGDGIYCFYPAQDLDVAVRNVDIVRDYLMDEVNPRTGDDPVRSKPEGESDGIGPAPL